jgi:serine protease AprX
MERSKFISIAATALIMVAVAISAPTGLLQKAEIGEGKIDSSLSERLEGSGDGTLPAIVILKSDTMPDLDGLKVRYSYHLIDGLAIEASASEVMSLAGDEAVEKLYLDGTIQAAQPASGQANSSKGDVCPSENLNAEKLWAQGIDGRGVIIAILDSGIDKNHPDLAGRVVGEINFVDDEETTRDLLGHGTLVAGIIAGSGAASGGKYKGIAPGASLLNIRVIDSAGNGQVSDIIAGIEWALDNNAKVISLSLAGLNLGETNPPVTMAADNAVDAGAVVCVAAGNNG